MIDVFDINVKVAITTSLVLIVALLTYIAFFKESKTSRKSSR